MVQALPNPEETAAAAVSVGQALALAGRSIQVGTGGPVWVYGEVDGLSRSKAGHLYWCLADEAARLSVVAFRSEAIRLSGTLSRAGVEMANGLAIRVFGNLEVYAPKGQVQLHALAVDPTVSVGQQALARQATRAALGTAGLLEAQRGLSLSSVPLELGVVAPAGQGLGDLLGRLEAAPWAWRVWVATTASEGKAAPRAIAAALEALGGCDVVILARGGGAGVTTAYDSDEVATAVCRCQAPVMVAVGHTSDRSLADECAFASVATPTAVADRLSAHLEAADQALVIEARAAAAAARAVLARAGSALEAEARAIDSTQAQLGQTIAARAQADTAVAQARQTRRAAVAAVVAVVILIVVLALVLMGA